jgi:hypothetical protein
LYALVHGAAHGETVRCFHRDNGHLTRHGQTEFQQPARRKIDRKTIQSLLEPESDEGGSTDKEGMTAAVCELADRTYRNVWSPVLAAILKE